MARPTKSRNLFIQQAGRGTRTFPGKQNCILLDHAGNTAYHGYPTDEDEEIDLTGIKRQTPQAETKVCKMCFAMYRASICPECGVRPEPPEITEEREGPEEVDGELIEIHEQDLIGRQHRLLLKEAKKTGKKAGWAHFKLIDRVGFEKAQSFIPEWVKAKYIESSTNLFPNPGGFIGRPFRRI